MRKIVTLVCVYVNFKQKATRPFFIVKIFVFLFFMKKYENNLPQMV